MEVYELKIEIELPDYVVNYLKAAAQFGGKPVEQYLREAVTSYVNSDMELLCSSDLVIWNGGALRKNTG